MRTMKHVAGCLLAVALILIAQAALAAEVDPIGYVQATRGDVVAVNENAEVQQLTNKAKVRPMYRNAALYQQDMIVTGAQSKAQLMFNDGTIFSVDESSQVRLEQFAYSFREKEGNILKFIFGPGLFRFLTGKLVDRTPKAFELATPLGTIGIRGTDGGIEAPAADSAGHAAQMQEIVALEEAGPDAQQNAAALFQRGMGFKVDEEKVFHFKGPSNRIMSFDDAVTKRTVEIPRGSFITITSKEGSGEPQKVPFGYRGAVPSVDTKIAPPAGLQGVMGDGGGDAVGGGDGGGRGGCGCE